jgi:hypothetical protein
MKKKGLVIVLLACCTFVNTYSQVWSAVGEGLNGKGVAMIVYDGELYVGGEFTEAGGVSANHIAKWDGSRWSAVGEGTNAAVYTMGIYHDELYVGGTFDTVSGITTGCVAKWNGTEWSALGNGIYRGGQGAGVKGFGVYQDELYIGGSFPINNGNPSRRIAKWNGTDWLPVAQEIMDNSYCQMIECFAEYEGELYVGGSFNLNIDTVVAESIMRFDGTEWKTVGMGIPYGSPKTLQVDQGDLYVSGWFPAAYGNPGKSIAKWDGTNWHSVGGGFAEDDWEEGRAYGCTSYQNQLFFCGNIYYAGPVEALGLASWNGASWTAYGNVNGPYNSLGVQAMIEYNGSLYVTGYLTEADGVPVNRIARLTFTTDIGSLEGNEFTIYPNPATSNITIQSKTPLTQVSLSDMSGRRVVTQTLKQLQGDVSTDVSALPSGIYLVEVITEGGRRSVQKVMIE